MACCIAFSLSTDFFEIFLCLESKGDDWLEFLREVLFLEKMLACTVGEPIVLLSLWFVLFD